MNEARTRGLRLAAKITGIGAIAIAGAALVEARAAAATTPEPAGEAAYAGAEDAFKVQPHGGGGCGCSPCWGPPAPPARGAWS